MRIRKWIILPAAALLLLCGCGRQTNAEPAADTSAAEQTLQAVPEAASDDLEVMFSLPAADDAPETIAPVNEAAKPPTTTAKAAAAAKALTTAAKTATTATTATKAEAATTTAKAASTAATTAEAVTTSAAAAQTSAAAATTLSGGSSGGSAATPVSTTIKPETPTEAKPSEPSTTPGETLPTADSSKERFELPAIPLR